MRPINAATACWPGEYHEEAVRRLVAGCSEPAFGAVATDHIQLCPQNLGLLDEQRLSLLRALAPNAQFRLHANAKVSEKASRPGRGDAADYQDNVEHFDAIVRVSAELKAPAYTLHAGRRAHASPAKMRANVLALQQRMGVPVGVEGLYPDARGTWLLATWDDYRWLLLSDLYYALDLSHLNIVAAASGTREDNLVRELLACERCVEVHVSGNSGKSDDHRVSTSRAWWWSLLEHTHPACVIFTEGNHKVEERRNAPRNVPLQQLGPVPASGVAA